VETPRDLGCAELWQASLERSLARRGRLPRSSLALSRLRPERNLALEEFAIESALYWHTRRRAAAKRPLMPTAVGVGGVSTLALLAATTLPNVLGARGGSDERRAQLASALSQAGTSAGATSRPLRRLGAGEAARSSDPTAPSPTPSSSTPTALPPALSSSAAPQAVHAPAVAGPTHANLARPPGRLGASADRSARAGGARHLVLHHPTTERLLVVRHRQTGSGTRQTATHRPHAATRKPHVAVHHPHSGPRRAHVVVHHPQLHAAGHRHHPHAGTGKRHVVVHHPQLHAAGHRHHPHAGTGKRHVVVHHPRAGTHTAADHRHTVTRLVVHHHAHAEVRVAAHHPHPTLHAPTHHARAATREGHLVVGHRRTGSGGAGIGPRRSHPAASSSLKPHSGAASEHPAAQLARPAAPPAGQRHTAPGPARPAAPPAGTSRSAGPSPSSKSVAPHASSHGYVNPLAGASVTPERIDQGVDYAGSGPLGAIGEAKVTYIGTSGTGWPGAFVEYQLLDGPDSGRFVYYAEGVSPAPGLSVGDTLHAGQPVARIIAGYSSGIEIGWGSGVGTQTAAQAAGEWSSAKDADSVPSGSGDSFSSLVASLGGPPGKIEG